MNISSKLIILLMILGLLACSTVVTKEEPPEVTEEGLHLVKDSKLTLVYSVPEASLEGYKRIWLVEPHVAFKKNWQRDQNRSKGIKVSNADMEKIRTRLAKEFTAVFAEVLQGSDGYELVEERADDVLILRPAIVNLDATAPDTMSAGRSKTYTSYAGEMTLYLEVYDSQTNALIAKALDRRTDNRTGFITWTNSASNTQSARRVLRKWAQSLRDGLDEANTVTGH
ncbi:MAG: DUF3313 domain-containing protein [Gammaproteobacteria bacterium]|nr:DUF3313 domain-containing protein [Gammaproteobacteria bacterium]